MSITTIQSRAGNFTSSQIYKLMTNDRKGTGIGSAGLTYINQKRREAKLGRQLQSEINTHAITWGKFLQHRVTNVLLDIGCKPTKDIRRIHPLISNWTGAEDYLRDDAIGEVKCFELDNFTFTHDCATAGYETLREECPDIFWQLVSNAILCDKPKAELVLYVPYQSELSAIREEAESIDDHRFSWIKFASDDEMPYLIQGHHYPNLSKFTCNIPESDRLALTNRVLMAVKMLGEFKK